MRLLFVGENWRGSSARSLREALQRRSDVVLSEVAEDQFLPRYQTLPLRLANRILGRWQRAELEEEVRRKTAILEPEVLMVYKGSGVSEKLVNEVASAGVATVNVFPDCSPHAHGPRLARALGCYDLVVSTKPFHPERWASTYGYANKCKFVPHGYDEDVHYWPKLSEDHQYDVVLAASWRPEYQQLMADLTRELRGYEASVAIMGPRWAERWNKVPDSWTILGGLYGRAYGKFVRSGKVAIAPVNRRMAIGGRQQPGDEDTTRTYELAAAHTFFLHQRTDYVQTVYDEETEVPMWESPSELADLIRYYLPREEERRAMAEAAHARAVPAYSVNARAADLMRLLKTELDTGII